MNQIPQGQEQTQAEQSSAIDLAQRVATMETGIGMTEWMNVKVNAAFKQSVRIVAAILHTSASQIAREAIFAWMEDRYPSFIKIYHEQLIEHYNKLRGQHD